MFDVKTTLLILTVMVTMQGLVWLMVWWAQRRYYELKVLAAGFILSAIGILMTGVFEFIPLPVAVKISAQSCSLVTGYVLLAHGIARFLGQRARPAILVACVVVALVFWPVETTMTPNDVVLRILVYDVLIIVASVYVVWVFAVDRTQPALLRHITMALFGAHVVALAVRSTLVYQATLDPTHVVVLGEQTWYYFFQIAFAFGAFLAFLLAVGTRMAADIGQRTKALQREVEQRERLQHRLSDSLRQEQTLRAEQSQLLRMVTHEFRTPLAIVDRAAEMIGLTAADSPDIVVERARRIRGAVQRLTHLIERFLDSERHDLDVTLPERIDLRGLVADVRRHFEVIGGAERLRFSSAGVLPAYVGDPEMLATVFINLIDNALKYAPGDSPVEIAGRRDGDALVVTVADRGIGIPPGDVTSVGRRYFRASNTRAATGTGLGLYNARRLLDYHGGELALANRDGGGTVATVRLPLPGLATSLAKEAVA